MRRIALFLGILAAGTPAFELTPWEAGQWVTYADVDGEAAVTVSLVEPAGHAEAPWLQVDLLMPGMGWMVLQMALKEGGAEFLQEDIARHIREPGAQEAPFENLESLLAYYGNFGGEILLGMDSSEMVDRIVLSLTPEMLGEFLSALGELGEMFGAGESLEYETQDGVEVEVPAGVFSCRKISSDSGDAWYADEVPLFGVARFSIPDSSGATDVVVELTDYGSSGATDSLEGWPDPLPIEDYLGLLVSGQSYEPYTDQDALANKKPR
ncbi:MAG TPA: hypothetical protein VM054_08150 [bacterium]|nr:hypothetical protein [bacterium]